MYMMIFVLDDPALLDQVLDAWCSAGVFGATIIESTGLHRRFRKHIPMRYSYGSVPVEEKGNYTLFAIVNDEERIQDCLAATEKVVGDLDEPNSGVFAAFPLSVIKGISQQKGN